MIMIGIESDAAELYDQMIRYPERYFFILAIEGRLAICIQTCDRHGEDMKIREIDGLKPDPSGNLISVFQEDLQEISTKKEHCTESLEDEVYSISPSIKKKIRELPGLIDWIMTSVLADGRCLILYPSWSI